MVHRNLFNASFPSQIMADEKSEIKTEKNTEKAKADWVKMKPAELQKIVLDLHKEGNDPAKIGLILRDKYGIPKAKLLGKKIIHILMENNLTPKKEKQIVQEKMDKTNAHISQHKHDYTAKRSFTKNQWVIIKLNKQEAALAH